MSKESYERGFRKVAEDYGVDPDELKKYVPEDTLKGDLKNQKTLELLKK